MWRPPGGQSAGCRPVAPSRNDHLYHVPRAGSEGSTGAPYASAPLLSGFSAGHSIAATRPGDPFPVRDPRYPPSALYVTPDFGRAAGLTMLHGRFLTAADSSSSGRPVVIDESLARDIFGSTDGVGRTVLLRREVRGEQAQTVVYEAEVVGVAATLGRASGDAPSVHR